MSNKQCVICRKKIFISRYKGGAIYLRKTCSRNCLSLFESKIRKGIKRSDSFKKNLSILKTGKGNPNWAGDNVGYVGLHLWVKKRLFKPKRCQFCNNKPPYDLANKGIYSRDLNNWEWLCRKCHMTKDGRINNLKSSLWNVNCAK